MEIVIPGVLSGATLLCRAASVLPEGQSEWRGSWN